MVGERGEGAGGYACVVVAALLWATSGVVGKALFAGGVTPQSLVQARVTFSSLLLAAALALWDPARLRVRRKDLPCFAALGAGLALVQVTYFLAISKIEVAAAVLLEYMAPILIAGFSLLFWGERATAAKLAALGLSVVGCYLAVGGYSLRLLEMNRAGIAAGLISAAAFAGYSLLGERGMHRYSAWTVLFYGLAFAAVFMHLFFRPFSYLGAGYSLAQWGRILYIVVAGTVIPFGLYFVGVDRVRSTGASITAALEPIAAGFVAYAVLGETLAPLRVFGGALVIAAVVLLQLEKSQGQRAPSQIRARRAQDDARGPNPHAAVRSGKGVSSGAAQRV